MTSTINRPITNLENIALAVTTQFFKIALEQIVPFVQTAQAGNNSHKFDRETGVFQIGHSGEPGFAHYHVIGRGDPEAEFIPGIKLDGPIPGLNFDMMAKTASEQGNEAKVKWNEGDMEKAVIHIKDIIEKLKGNEEFKKYGLTVITS